VEEKMKGTKPKLIEGINEEQWLIFRGDCLKNKVRVPEAINQLIKEYNKKIKVKRRRNE